MTFNSLTFLLFFLIVFPVYWSLPRRAQNLWLLAASYVFYGWWDWAFLSLILLSTVVDYFAALRIAGARDRATAKRWLTLSVVLNLGVLGVFKYFDFFVESLAESLQLLGVPVSLRTLGIVVPVGISFYTFQTMSYTIDVYRGELRPAKRLLDFALFVSFFPQLVAGPIERATNLLPQMEQPRSAKLDRMLSGLPLIAWGLFKKVVIADNLALLVVDPIFDRSLRLGGGGTILIGAYAFAFQIYCDFSGYTDIAIGTGRLLGFELRTNFNRPYFATSPSDFWSRWHISLSSWLRDYLYIPLGGNRTGKTYRNLMLTMLLGGLWHGAQWTFVLWGAYHGVLLILFRAFADRGLRLQLSRPMRTVIMFHLICLSWLIFRAQDVDQLGAILTSIVTDPLLIEDPNWMFTRNLIVFAGPLVLVELFITVRGAFFAALPWAVRTVVYVVAFYTFMILGAFGGKAFIYFQF